MATTWFRGGLQMWHELGSAWTGAHNHYCSVLQGGSIPTTTKNHITLAQFLADAGNPSFLGNEISLDGRKTITFDAASNQYRLQFTNELNFGPVTQGTAMAGVVYYSSISAANRGTPSDCEVWASQETPAVTANGGDVKFGSSGNNIALYMECIKSPSSGGGSNTLSPFQGTLSSLHQYSQYWSSATVFDLGYALVRNTNTAEPSTDWNTMSDLTSAGVAYITGATPADSPVDTPYTERTGPTFSGNYHDYNIEPEGATRTPVTWPSAQLTSAVGQTITAVVVYNYDGTGAYNENTARIIHWDNVTDYTIAAATDVTYMQSAQVTLNSIQMM